MGVDVMALMGLLTGGGNLLGQVGNLGTQGLGNMNTVMDMLRYWQRNQDPLLSELRETEINRYNESPYGPYGDVGGAYDAMWGTRADGSPVQYGDMAARQFNTMLNNNPGETAIDVLTQGSQIARPEGQDFAAMFGGNPSGKAYTPATLNVGDMKPVRGHTGVQGLPAVASPEPELSKPRSGGVVTNALNNLDSDTLSGILSGAIQGWRGGGGSGDGGSSGSGGGNSNPYAGFWQDTMTPGGSWGFRDRSGNTGNSAGKATAPKSYAVGTPYVPETGKVKVHKGEAITPAAVNPNAVKSATGTTAPAAGVTPGEPYDLNAGRVGVLSNMLQNPESLGVDAQAGILQGYKDERDKAYLDEQRQIREMFGGAGTGNSGVQDKLMMDATLGRSADISGAKRDIGVEAARTNFNDRINAANTGLGHQLGMGQAALDYDKYQQDLVDKDRAYSMQLANQLFGTGVNAQQQQQNLLGGLGSLTAAGTSHQQGALARIWQQLMSRYANPDVSTAQQYSYAANPYLQTGGGGSSGGGTDWFNTALSTAQTAAMFV